MSKVPRGHVVIIGAGFGGLSAAKELAITAYDVELRHVSEVNGLITGISGARMEDMTRLERVAPLPQLMRSTG